jgi:hypothetical protein
MKPYFGIELDAGRQWALPNGENVGTVFVFPGEASRDMWVRNAEAHGPKCKRYPLDLNQEPWLASCTFTFAKWEVGE